jgi:hypothetical protein
VGLVQERRKGNMTERIVRASAAAYAKPADRAAFVGELTDAIARIISKYQIETGRPHRLIVAVHPSITEDADPPAKEQQQS